VSSTISDSTGSETDDKLSPYGEMRYAVGLRANRLGDVVTESGDRLIGEGPEGVAETFAISGVNPRARSA
jgi:hypothetical protein